MGEFDAIGRIRALAEQAAGNSLLSLGIGDDCCLLDCPGGELLALSTDTMVEGVHFSTRYFSWRDAAGRACAAAISDLAAMAAEPVCMLAAATVPKTGGEKILDELAEGFLEAASLWNCPLAGGDLASTTGPVTLTITVAGRCAPAAALRRSGASPGDEIWITGECGDPSAAIELLERAGAECGSALQNLPENVQNSLFRPTPRLREAAELLELGPPTAMIDVSDGVAADTGHILEESGCGAVLERKALPAGEFSRRRAEDCGLPAEHYFLHGGEDFQLLFTLRSGKLEQTGRELNCGTRITRIGRITAETGKLLIENSDGTLEPLERSGFDHLA